MIYITGDCHGDYRRFNNDIFPEQKQMKKEDFVIICGDFGFWDNSNEQKYWRKWLDQRCFTTLWVDGNHENYDLLKEYPKLDWNGGKVQYIAPSILHLCRGEVFTIENRKFFTFGGAASHDIQDGILEKDDIDFKQKKKSLDSLGALYRINHVSWWKEEMPSEEEYRLGLKNLEMAEWKVDFVISHCCPSNVQALFSGGLFKPDRLTDYFEQISQRLYFNKWLFGHYHGNRQFLSRYIGLYEQIIRIV